MNALLMTEVIRHPPVYFLSILTTFLNYAEVKDMYFNYRFFLGCCHFNVSWQVLDQMQHRTKAEFSHLICLFAVDTVTRGLVREYAG